MESVVVMQLLRLRFHQVEEYNYILQCKKARELRDWKIFLMSYNISKLVYQQKALNLVILWMKNYDKSQKNKLKINKDGSCILTLIRWIWLWLSIKSKDLKDV